MSIDNKNPLMLYKKSDPMLEWKMIENQSGVSIQTLISIAKKDEDKIGSITLLQAEKIKRSLGIDLGKYLIIK